VRDGSVEVDGTVVLGSPVTSYRITYRVRVAAGDDVTESIETIAVERPFRSRVEVSIDGDRTGRRVSRFGALAIEGDGGMRVLAVPPALGTSDVRPDAALPDAVERGLAERREVREVAGRRCRVYRVGSTVSDGTLVPLGTTTGEHADVCVDGDGLVLEEWWVQQGDALRHRLATEVEIGAPLARDLFELDGEPPPGPSDGSVTVVPTPDPPPPSVLAGGHRWLGRYEITTAALQQPGSVEAAPARMSVVDVWTSGADFVVLEQAPGTLAPTPYGMAIVVPGVGRAELVVDLRATELRLTTADGSTVRLYGTVSASELTAIAGALLAPPA